MANITITKEILESGRGSRGMWNLQQVKLFGITSMSVSLPKTILGKEFPEEVVKQYLALKDAHLTPEQLAVATRKNQARENEKELRSARKQEKHIARAEERLLLKEEKKFAASSERPPNPSIPNIPEQSSQNKISFNIILTDHIIEKAKSSSGGWSRQQLKLIGVSTGEESGIFKIDKYWKQTVIGKEYPNDVIQKFVELKDQHISTKKRNTITVPPFNINLDLDI